MENNEDVEFKIRFKEYYDKDKRNSRIRDDIKRLKEITYLDFAGAAPYVDTLINAIQNQLLNHNYYNPHSQNSIYSNEIEKAREAVLKYCNASNDEYDVIFTAGSTDSLKLISQSFPWTEESCYCYIADNHNSILGIRELCLKNNGYIITGNITSIINDNIEFKTIKKIYRNDKSNNKSNNEEEEMRVSLFAYPLESNFNGIRYNYKIIELLHKNKIKFTSDSDNIKRKWYVLLDSSKACGTWPPDLTQCCKPDFMIMSFYKIFGYPSGLGVLIIKKSTLKILKNEYFGGGTLDLSLFDRDYVIRRKGVEAWEYGTPDYLGISSIRIGFNMMNNIKEIDNHVLSLTYWLYEKMNELYHSNGIKVCEIYGYHQMILSNLLNDKSNVNDVIVGQGSIITFNIKNSQNEYISIKEFDKCAFDNNIILRTGRFCNPGACYNWLEVDSDMLLDSYNDGDTCNTVDIINEKPLGAIRISLGYCTLFKDVLTFFNFIKKYYYYNYGDVKYQDINNGGDEGIVTRMYIYPVKSCGAQEIYDAWPLNNSGFLYDRQWIIVNDKGKALTLKNYPKLHKIKPEISLKYKTLTLNYETSKITIPIIEIEDNMIKNENIKLKLCGRSINSMIYNNDDVSEWLEKVIGEKKVRLMYTGDENRYNNKGNILMISEESIEYLHKKIEAIDKEELILRFRPNLIIRMISRKKEHIENEWIKFYINNIRFSDIIECNRCSVININLSVDNKYHQELTSIISEYNKKLSFGIYCSSSSSSSSSSNININSKKDNWIHCKNKVIGYKRIDEV